MYQTPPKVRSSPIIYAPSINLCSVSLQTSHLSNLISLNSNINQLPFNNVRVIGVEALHDMKRGKQSIRGKSFRKAMAPWTYRRVLNRIECKAQENRVLLVRVDSANTSRTCPACGAVHKDNRRGEKF